MKKVALTTLLTVATSLAMFAQQKSWGTKTIGQWTFEKFPLHYYVVPTKTTTSKNRITGKLESYQELNQYGQATGLYLIMSADGINPNSATYTYKGEIVYSVTFFPASKVAQMIVNNNTEGLYDGYKIYRELKNAGGYKEDNEKYDNGIVIEINGIKQAKVSSTYKDSILDGRFKFERNEVALEIEGEAGNGKLKRIKQLFEGKYEMREIVFATDSFIVKEPNDYKAVIFKEGEFSSESYSLISNPTITNSKANCLKYGNYNGYPYLYIPNDFNVKHLEELLKTYHPEPLETKANYVDSLLDGDFQYREYQNYSSGMFSGNYIDVLGKAQKGKLLIISLSTIKFNTNNGKIESNKKVEYIFQEDKIVQNDYVPQVSNEPVATKTLKLEYPVLLSNSNKLGGIVEFSDNNLDIFGLPQKRNSKFYNNQYGHIYFSPYTFDITTFLRIVTTKTPKPIERKINEVNGILNGYFEFRGYVTTFSGNAQNGIIQRLKIQYDSEQDVYGKRLKYDIIEYVLNGNAYSKTYLSSSTNQVVYQEEIAFNKNKKITGSKDLAGYDGFIYYNDNDEETTVNSQQRLSSILEDLKFIDIQYK